MCIRDRVYITAIPIFGVRAVWPDVPHVAFKIYLLRITLRTFKDLIRILAKSSFVNYELWLPSIAEFGEKSSVGILNGIVNIVLKSLV